MRTSKPISTISYNSLEFLTQKLEELINNHRICDYMFITHKAEQDEKKDHIHLWIKPNTLLDTMDLQNFLTELDLKNPTKPLKCIDFRLTHDTDEWVLYVQHYAPYLASKGESREYYYSKSDFHYHDEDTFDDLYLHAFKGSKWAHQNQILEQLRNGLISPVDLINNGTVPLNLASQLNAYKYLQTHYSVLDRGGRENHEEKEDSMPSYSLGDSSVAEAILRYVSIHENFVEYTKDCQYLQERLSFAEWIYNYSLLPFSAFCITEFGYSISEADG